jgi:hypothetical protein
MSRSKTHQARWIALDEPLSEKPWKSAEKAYLGLLSTPQSQTRAKDRWNWDLVRGQTAKSKLPASAHSRLGVFD